MRHCVVLFADLAVDCLLVEHLAVVNEVVFVSDLECFFLWVFGVYCLGVFVYLELLFMVFILID